MPECHKCNKKLILLNDHYWAAWQETFWECPSCHNTYATYNQKQESKLKRFLLEAIRIVQHNREHITTIHFLGEDVYACSRCLGVYSAALISYPFFLYLFLIGVTLPFYPVFISCIILASFTLMDFLSVDLLQIRKGNQRVRIITGVMLGISGMMYLFLLPMSWMFKLLTLLFYLMIALLVAIITSLVRRKNEVQTPAG